MWRSRQPYFYEIIGQEKECRLKLRYFAGKYIYYSF